MELFVNRISKVVSVLTITAFLFTNIAYASPSNLRVPMISKSRIEQGVGKYDNEELSKIFKDNFNVTLTSAQLNSLPERTKEFLSQSSNISNLINNEISAEIQDTKYEIAKAGVKNIPDNEQKIKYISEIIDPGKKYKAGKISEERYAETFKIADSNQISAEIANISYYVLQFKPKLLAYESALMKIAAYNALGHKVIPYEFGGEKGLAINEKLLKELKNSYKIYLIGSETGDEFIKIQPVVSSVDLAVGLGKGQDKPLIDPKGLPFGEFFTGKMTNAEVLKMINEQGLALSQEELAAIFTAYKKEGNMQALQSAQGRLKATQINNMEQRWQKYAASHPDIKPVFNLANPDSQTIKISPDMAKARNIAELDSDGQTLKKRPNGQFKGHMGEFFPKLKIVPQEFVPFLIICISRTLI